ncbi:unnamed protein product [Caenorhabditis angaria]|uniref:Myosin motor domain-containing protein n=1 Tax=Caenorhabditis angaria TaxID=860376 RepID=A0A9P1MXF6_9PELO|nr:unnamed protein product [Caenorhabditis angaria]
MNSSTRTSNKPTSSLSSGGAIQKPKEKPSTVKFLSSRPLRDPDYFSFPVAAQQKQKQVNKKVSQKMMEIEQKEGDFGRLVWISDPVDGFVLARIRDISQDGFELQIEKSGEMVKRKYDETFACEDDLNKSVEDNCALMHLNEATLLANCKKRYENQKIYSYVANILISINPYEQIQDFYGPAQIQAYRGKSLGQKEPHIFAIADKSYREMRRHQTSQSIIVSGESGAGKTESQKAVLRYLCENWGERSGPIQQRLLETNPILEAFGNAKTLRNNNSSRFGKFVQIHFSDAGNVAGGFISHYLLETSRICRQSEGERNYHIFYQLIAGASKDLYEHLKLAQAGAFNYLRHGSTTHFGTGPNETRDPMVNDKQDLLRLSKSLTLSGIGEKEQTFIWETIGGILHLGNVEFEENAADSRGGSKITAESETSLANSARLLGLEVEEMKLGLCARIMQATKGGVKGTLIRVPLKPHEAAAGRDALAKSIYSKLFDWLVENVNKSIPCEQTNSKFIGVLDVAGFEFFAVNSFEQFCINFCNEKLQNFFNERILKQEQELYLAEGLNIQKIEFSDNLDCIELFEKRAVGLFDLLDEEAKLPRATPQHFTQRAHEANAKHFRLDTPRKSKIRAHREMRDDEGLLIRHYAGSVCYETRYFVDKNNDQLHNSLEMLIEQSSSPIMVSLYTQEPSNQPKTGGKLKAASVGSKFKSQLLVLLEKLQKTGTHFVRCVKPNNEMKAWKFDGSSIFGQLECAGMTSVLKLMQQGFPSRTSFQELYQMYQPILPANLARLESPPVFEMPLPRAGFEFARLSIRVDQGVLPRRKELIGKVREWLVKARWRKAQYGAWSVLKLKNKILYRRQQICKIQSVIRGYLVRKRFQKRIAIYRRACALLEQSREMTDILGRLNESSKQKWESTASSTSSELENLVSTIKSTEIEAEIDRAVKKYEECVKKVDSIIADLKSQLETDELAEMQRKRAELAEKERREQEERETVEKERQVRRKMEEERERAQREYEAQLEKQKAVEAEAEAAENARREKESRERLDGLVSTRLAKSDGIQLIQQEHVVAAAQQASKSANSNSKYDLSNWKYADLRDAINTSNDMQLLVACKEEFHRRLRIYNEWKTKNAGAAKNLAPQILGSATSSSATQMRPTLNPALTQQRYFKMAFAVQNTVKMQSGLCYAHFNGQYIQRQVTLIPQQKPQLMVAGKDDLRMIDLPLEQTGLLRKKGAEISATDFDTIWQHYGGQPVTKWTP